MSEIIEKAKEFFKNIVKESKDPYHLLTHLDVFGFCVEHVLKKIKADEEIVLLGMWFHDSGTYPLNDEDHAIIGEKIARKFLTKEDYNKDKINAVCHCVRAHRNNDVPPETNEAKVIAFCDSLSHMTNGCYLDMVNKKQDDIKGKLERDYRDLDFFPEIKKEFETLYEFWKTWIKLNERA